MTNRHWKHNVTDGITLKPDENAFVDPLQYVQTTASQITPCGIAKILPPDLPGPSSVDRLRTPNISTTQQFVRNQTWDDFGCTRATAGSPKSFESFHTLADATARRVFRSSLQPPAATVEDSFWAHQCGTQGGSEEFAVECGEGVGRGIRSGHDGSDFGALNSMDLSSIARSAQSCMRHLRDEVVPRVSAPCMLYGMLFASTGWHVSEGNMWSMEYNHAGAPKTWYCVPAKFAEQFEDAVREKVYKQAVQKLQSQHMPDDQVHAQVLQVLAEATTIFSPEVLLLEDIPVTRIVQWPGEIVVTCPRAYHMSFCHGVVISEAVDFATKDWFDFGADAMLRHSFLQTAPAFAFEQIVCMEMLALAEACAKQADSPGNLAHWLLDNPGALDEADVPLIVTFCRLIRWYHRHLQALKHSGFAVMHQSIDMPVPCYCSKEALHLAAVLPDGAVNPMALRRYVGRNAAGGTVFLHDQFPRYLEIAQAFSPVCARQGWGGVTPDNWRANGLTDRLRLPGHNSDFTWENLLEEYPWASSDLNLGGPAGSLSPGDVPRPTGKSLDLLESLLPPAASEASSASVPATASGKASAAARKAGRGVRGSKRGQADKAGGKGAEPWERDDDVVHKGSDGDPSRTGPSGAVTAAAQGSKEESRRRTSRTTAMNCISMWKNNGVLITDGEDSLTDSGSMPRRPKKTKRAEDAASSPQGAPPAKQPGGSSAGLAKVYQNAANNAANNTSGSAAAGNNPANSNPCVHGSSSRLTPSASAEPLQRANSMQQPAPSPSPPNPGMNSSPMPYGGMPMQNKWGGGQHGHDIGGGSFPMGGPGGPPGSASPSMQHMHGSLGRMDSYLKTLRDINERWRVKMQESLLTNADLHQIRMYLMGLPGVETVYHGNTLGNHQGGPGAGPGPGGPFNGRGSHGPPGAPMPSVVGRKDMQPQGLPSGQSVMTRNPGAMGYGSVHAPGPMDDIGGFGTHPSHPNGSTPPPVTNPMGWGGGGAGSSGRGGRASASPGKVNLHHGPISPGDLAGGGRERSAANDVPEELKKPSALGETSADIAGWGGAERLPSTRSRGNDTISGHDGRADAPTTSAGGLQEPQTSQPASVAQATAMPTSPGPMTPGGSIDTPHCPSLPGEDHEESFTDLIKFLGNEGELEI